MSDDVKKKDGSAEEEPATSPAGEKSTDAEKDVAKAEAEKAKPTAGEKDEKKPEAAEKPKPEKTAAKANPKPTAKPAGSSRHALGAPVWVALVVIALVGGVLAGHFLLPSGSSISLGGRTTLSSGELDSTIARYTYNGATANVTTRDVITQNQSLDAVVNDDGTYNVPGPSDVISYVQYKIMFDEADRRGLTATDEEMDAYAQSTLGTSDYVQIASAQNMDEDALKTLVRNMTSLSKLRDSVVTTQVPTQPTKPTVPADGQEDVATGDYATYVINLLGDEWDSEAGTWAREDGDFYKTLSGYEITADAATYAAAQAAYSVAYSKYTTAATQASNEWNAFANSLFSQTNIELGSLATPSSSSAQ